MINHTKLPVITTTENIIVRKGLPEDAQDFANLMLLSAPTLFFNIYGPGAKSVIRYLFRQRKNLFSFEHSYFIEKDGVKAGMIIGYDWKTVREEKWRTGLLLIKYMRYKFFAKILPLLKTKNIVGKVEDNEYYISNVAVYSKFRDGKLGTNILSKIEREARRYSAGKIALDVEVGNQGATRLYNRLGYSVVGKPRRAKINGKEFAFLGMCKKLMTI